MAGSGEGLAMPGWRLGAVVHQALARVWLDRGLSVFAIAALVLPTLLMGNLARVQREGVNAAVAALDADARLHRLTVEAGQGQDPQALDADWFARARRWPGVAFVVPWVRAAAPLVAASGAGVDANAPRTLELWATAGGDPLLGGRAAPEGFAVLVGASAARQLDLGVGKTLRFAVHRQRNGATESAPIELTVEAVLAANAATDALALVPLPLLEGLQAWVEGRAVKGIGGERRGDELPARSWTRLRLYTQHAADLPEVDDRLRQMGLPTRSQAVLVADAQALQRGLTRERRTIVAIAWALGLLLYGAVLALALRRHRDEHRLLRITGHGRSWLWGLQLLHGVCLALLVTFIVTLAMLAGWPLRTPDLIEGALVVLAGVLACAVPAAVWALRGEASLRAFGRGAVQAKASGAQPASAAPR